jgi:alpha-tubulin suppressor-like RCC1 family protein
VASVGAPPFEVAEHRANLQVKEKWRAVSAGGVHTCAIAALDGSGYCWGSNLQGQLGVGFDNFTLPQTPQPRRIATSHRFTEIRAGAEHSCGRENFQTLLCWGSRARGALGDGACIGGFGTNCFTAAESPVEIVSGGNLGGAQLHLDQLVVGGTFTCIVTTTGGSGSFASRDVRCWGTADENGRGIALADSAASAPVLQPGLSGNAQITEVTAGGAHLCTKTDDIFWVRCKGINDHAQLGDGTVGNEPGPPYYPKDFTIVGGDPAFPGGDGYPTSTVTAGGSHTCALDAIGVLCWGSNASGQLGSAVAGDAVYPTRATLGVAVIALTAGEAHTCGLTSTGDVWCWGSNSNGQLGRGTIGGSSSAPALVTGGLTFVSISANGAHTCGVTTDGSIYCWGANLFGQLGDGTLIDRGAPARVVESPQ